MGLREDPATGAVSAALRTGLEDQPKLPRGRGNQEGTISLEVVDPKASLVPYPLTLSNWFTVGLRMLSGGRLKLCVLSKLTPECTPAVARVGTGSTSDASISTPT